MKLKFRGLGGRRARQSCLGWNSSFLVACGHCEPPKYRPTDLAKASAESQPPDLRYFSHHCSGDRVSSDGIELPQLQPPHSNCTSLHSRQSKPMLQLHLFAECERGLAVGKASGACLQKICKNICLSSATLPLFFATSIAKGQSRHSYVFRCALSGVGND